VSRTRRRRIHMRELDRVFDRIQRAWEAEEGATLIEAAVGLVIILALFIGLLEICLALYASHFVADAAREASRYAIVRGSMSCSTTPNLSNCDVTSDEVQTWVRSLGYPGINPQQLTVTATWPSSGSDCYPSTSPCNNPGNLVKVDVNYAFPLVIPFWKNPTINLRSASEMVISQ
jgi:Flp pilus assembly protein TadG